MEMQLDSETTIQDVFNVSSSDADDFGFSKTQLFIQLAKYDDDQLVSRSQVKRIAARLREFKEVLLDFRGITHIGPAFADEIFRVFRNEHEAAHLRWTNVDRDVDKMIRRAMIKPGDHSAVGQTDVTVWPSFQTG